MKSYGSTLSHVILVAKSTNFSWKHHYEVIDVRPHAVRLRIPPDAPPVMEWQSLRKCSKAPSQLHDYSSTVPVDIRGHLLTTPPVSDVMDASVSGKQEAIRYLIERILRAERKGSGWQLTVKWVGYDEVTYEPLSRIVADTRGDPDIARQIRECQEAYLIEHPSLDTDDVPFTEVTNHLPKTVTVPTRVQPIRNSNNSQFQGTRSIHALIAEINSPNYLYTCDMLATSCRHLAHRVRCRVALGVWMQGG